MISKTPINPSRIRKIKGSFSWIDHRLITSGFLAQMSSDEILLYFFLVLVGDRHGVSFYGYDKICSLLKIDVDRFVAARAGLVNQLLIAYEDGRYQVLQLPERPKQTVNVSTRERHNRERDFRALAEIFQEAITKKR